MAQNHKSYRFDYVVVGAGVAGLRAAIELASAGTVLVLAKSGLSDSTTSLAEGGIVVALSDEDQVSLHAQDTIEAGEGLCRPEAVALLVQEGPQYITQLIEWSAEFDRAGTKLAFTPEAAHSRSRVLHARGNSTGREIARALLARAHSLAHLDLRDHAFTSELLVESNRVVGVRFLDDLDGSTHEVTAGAVLLASGGVGRIYRETTNPDLATGDGMAIAYEAGAVLSDMEFMQFHPTTLAVKGAPRFLLSESLRCEGGILRNVNLERFMKRYHDAQELAPRDVVARAISSEMHHTNSEFVYLDMTAKRQEFLQKRFPRIYESCSRQGVDLATDLAPVCPAAHYIMGGIKTDLGGRTSLPGLYAAGETANAGVHGANRLASNSLLEGLVFGARCGQTMIADAPPAKHKTAKVPPTPLAKHASAGDTHANKSAGNNASQPALDKIRELMWRYVGVLRNGKDLAAAISELQAMELPKHAKPSRIDYETRNLHSLALVMARSALAREESRGSHYRSDFPYRDDDDLCKHSLIAKGQDVRFEK